MNLQQIENDFVPIFNFEDAFLLDYVQNWFIIIIQKLSFLDKNGHLMTNFCDENRFKFIRTNIQIILVSAIYTRINS
jgi:hypothetical protein